VIKQPQLPAWHKRRQAGQAPFPLWSFENTYEQFAALQMLHTPHLLQK
jgi:hypothetical protein